MEEKELICEYCKVPIKESDHKCPNCGADCTKTIRDYKKYQKEQTIAAQYATKEEINKTFKRTGNVIGATFIIMIFIVIAFIVGGIFLTYKVISNQFNSNTTATAGFKEKASTSDMAVTLQEYDLYEYRSDQDTYANTPDGYQKIAFRFLIENKGHSELTSMFGFGIKLTADDYKVESATLEKCSTCQVVKGRDKYESFDRFDINPKAKEQGYVGFLVPKNRKKLVFDIGDNGFSDHIFIEMDNPAYKKSK